MAEPNDRGGRTGEGGQNSGWKRAGVSLRPDIHGLSICVQIFALPDCPLVSNIVQGPLFSTALITTTLFLFVISVLLCRGLVGRPNLKATFSIVPTVVFGSCAAIVTCRDLRLLTWIGLAPDYAAGPLLEILAQTGRLSPRSAAAATATFAVWFAVSAGLAAVVVRKEGGVGVVLIALLSCYALSIAAAIPVLRVSFARATGLAWWFVGVALLAICIFACGREAKDKAVLAALLVICAMSVAAVVDAARDKDARVEERDPTVNGGLEQ